MSVTPAGDLLPADLLDYARTMWPDSRKLSDAQLTSLLQVALEQATDYARGPLDAERFRLGVVYHARDIWNAVLRDQQDVIGVGEYAIRARPLSAVVKALLRPQLGPPGVG